MDNLILYSGLTAGFYLAIVLLFGIELSFDALRLRRFTTITPFQRITGIAMLVNAVSVVLPLVHSSVSVFVIAGLNDICVSMLVLGGSTLFRISYPKPFMWFGIMAPYVLLHGLQYLLGYQYGLLLAASILLYTFFLFIQLGFSLHNYDCRLKDQFADLDGHHTVWFFWVIPLVIGHVALAIYMVIDHMHEFGLYIFYNIYMTLFWVVFGRFALYQRLGVELEDSDSDMASEECIGEESNAGLCKKDCQKFNFDDQIKELFDDEKVYLYPDINVDYLCKRLSTNRTYLATYLRTEKQTTFYDMVNGYRIRYAQELLKADDTKIEIIAQESGYNSIRAFLRVFKMQTGQTPSEWRKQALSAVRTIGVVLLLALAGSNEAFAETRMPDFDSYFAELSEKRTRYNELNDSMYIIQDQALWLDLTLRRSDENYKMNVSNQRIIDEVLDYFYDQKQPKGDDGFHPLRPNLPEYAFDSLRNAIERHHLWVDPFMGELFEGGVLMRHYASLPDQTPEVRSKLALHYLNYGDCLYSFFCMGDSLALPKAYDMFRNCISVSEKNKEVDDAIQFFAISHLLARPRLNNEAGLSQKEATALYDRYQHYFQSQPFRIRLRKHPLYRYYSPTVQLAELYPLMRMRALAIMEPRFTPEQKALYDKEIQDGVDYWHSRFTEKRATKLDSERSFYTTNLLVRARVGLITYKVAADSALSFFNHMEAVANPRSFQPDQQAYTTQLRNLVYTSKDLLFLLDRSSAPIEVQRTVSDQIFIALSQFLKKRHHAQMEAQDNNLVILLLFDPLLRRYMTPEMINRNIRNTFIAVQIHTLAHYQTVVMLSQIITRNLLREEPNLFVGLPGYEDVHAVDEDPVTILGIITRGALIHDLGKLRMNQVIANEFRRLTDHEFELIKLHPEYAVDVLVMLPAYAAYTDFALGHHKWYDGTGGYPAWYDNTKSQYRVLLDILTLADCLEAATNRMSRNYRRHKTYEQIITEFSEESGTRYNPRILDVMLRSPEMQNELKTMINEGWKETFPQLFREAWVH